ncbi:hypothetical protein SynA1840_00940 [Synechococcus sp. A18-40]|nr:hypothetical protein SynA1840_00940 [Synechococcus sp. A18-40]
MAAFLFGLSSRSFNVLKDRLRLMYLPARFCPAQWRESFA